MREIIKFRAIISHRTIILFTLEDLVRPYLSFSIRELVIPWLRLGNKPDRYIGLKDCKGKEIYEGDVMQVETYPTESNPMGEPNLAVVSFEYGQFGWHQFNWRGEKSDRFEALFDYTGGAAMWVEAVVIGNIYENPELVEVQK